MTPDAPPIERHRAAIVRRDLSRPARLALEHGVLAPGSTAFDYGCGHGGDVERLRERGFEVGGWDPHYAPDAAVSAADVVNLGYVLNVIEDPAERADVLRRAWSLARRALVVSAQLLVDQSGAVKVPYGDGFLTRLNTFQKYFDHAELGAYVRDALGVEPVAAGLGVYYVFRDPADALALRARSSRRGTRASSARALRLVEQHGELLAPLIAFAREHGRAPVPEELPEAADIAAVFRTLPLAFSHVRRHTGAELWAEVAAERRADLLVFVALALFGGRPRFSDLPPDVQRDVRAHFGSYTTACREADALLLQLRDQDRVAAAGRASALGKRLPTALYVHESALPRLDPLLRVYEGCARAFVGDVEGANLLKLHLYQAQVSYLCYPDFDADPHPALAASVEVALRDRSIRMVRYAARANPPILHRKELFVADDHPEREAWAALTREEEAAGWYADPSRIGTRDGWAAVVRERGEGDGEG